MSSQLPVNVREATLEEKLVMSPWKKWKLYRIFPTKLVLEILLVVLVTIEVFIPIILSDDHVQACKESFDSMFMPEFDSHLIPAVSYFSVLETSP